MENHFYHIRWPPLNVTIFITQVRNGSYTSECMLGKLTTITSNFQSVKWCSFIFNMDSSDEKLCGSWSTGSIRVWLKLVKQNMELKVTPKQTIRNLALTCYKTMHIKVSSADIVCCIKLLSRLLTPWGAVWSVLQRCFKMTSRQQTAEL